MYKKARDLFGPFELSYLVSFSPATTQIYAKVLQKKVSLDIQN